VQVYLHVLTAVTAEHSHSIQPYNRTVQLYVQLWQ